ncbi:MADS-box protein AGL24-like [Aristolochia californica]|uniref:MADS-box protein AGL24-like n=1 Tax=Aristolochia californica TaxID=171875 RepID=UPI0035E1D78E
MGKRKPEMKKIENRQALQVTFSKRKKGLFKKADQLPILTGTSVLVVAFSPAGRPFVFGDEGLMQHYFEGETNFPKAVEDEEHLSLDNINLEQCSGDELELLVANLEEEEANILELGLIECDKAGLWASIDIPDVGGYTCCCGPQAPGVTPDPVALLC